MPASGTITAGKTKMHRTRTSRSSIRLCSFIIAEDGRRQRRERFVTRQSAKANAASGSSTGKGQRKFKNKNATRRTLIVLGDALIAAILEIDHNHVLLEVGAEARDAA